jgi:diguanylate cyclase (GGDEF)-like protein
MQIAAEPILFAGQTIPATVSIGVAERRDDDRDFADMLARADQALYLAKQDGRNCIRQS